MSLSQSQEPQPPQLNIHVQVGEILQSGTNGNHRVPQHRTGRWKQAASVEVNKLLNVFVEICADWSTKALIITRVQRGETQHSSLLSTLIMTVCVSEALSPWRPIKGLLTHYLEALPREDVYCPLDKGTVEKSCFPAQNTQTDTQTQKSCLVFLNG